MSSAARSSNVASASYIVTNCWVCASLVRDLHRVPVAGRDLDRLAGSDAAGGPPQPPTDSAWAARVTASIAAYGPSSGG